MDVYLIPVETDRYELYCEHVADEAAMSAEAPAGAGWFASIVHRVKSAIARVEHEQENGTAAPIDESGGWQDRMKRRMLCWVAGKVAEQRLLWRIRKESRATLFFPDDLTAESALAIARRMLRREADRHLKWSVIDGLLLCASAIVALVPGPNPVAYYFGFRFVGHVLSRRGATHALNVVQWDCASSPSLTTLRQAVPQTTSERDRTLRDVASALHLQHLATFFERTAIPPA
jgi:Mitochondrial K+-H+ exchange-related